MKRLSEWAKEQGVCYMTAYHWVKSGKMTVPFHVTPTGRIMVDTKESNEQVSIEGLMKKVSEQTQMLECLSKGLDDIKAELASRK